MSWKTFAWEIKTLGISAAPAPSWISFVCCGQDEYIVVPQESHQIINYSIVLYKDILYIFSTRIGLSSLVSACFNGINDHQKKDKTEWTHNRQEYQILCRGYLINLHFLLASLVGEEHPNIYATHLPRPKKSCFSRQVKVSLGGCQLWPCLAKRKMMLCTLYMKSRHSKYMNITRPWWIQQWRIVQVWLQESSMERIF